MEDEEVDDVQEPEAGLEPAGPDQSLPVASEPNPPAERKATSYINVSNNYCMSVFICYWFFLVYNHKYKYKINTSFSG